MKYKNLVLHLQSIWTLNETKMKKVRPFQIRIFNVCMIFFFLKGDLINFSKLVGSPSSELFPRTPLPSFSSIICTTESHESSLSVLTPSMAINSSAPDGDLWMDEVNHHLELENGRPVISGENHMKALPAEKIEKEKRESGCSQKWSFFTWCLVIKTSFVI
jgi:hypothetical protein